MLAEGQIAGLTVGSTAPLFLAVLAVHILAAFTALASGAVAALSAKGSARHVRAGHRYFRAIIGVFVTAVALAAMRWHQDYYLVAIGAVALGTAVLGVRHRRRNRPGDAGHIIGMGASYAVMLTAFYVDNGPHLPLWDRLPTAAYWLLPAVVATPIIVRAVLRSRSCPLPAPQSLPKDDRHAA